MAGNTKVDDRHPLYLTTAQKKIGRLEVAVDDAVLVGDNQRFGGAAQQRQLWTAASGSSPRPPAAGWKTAAK